MAFFERQLCSSSCISYPKSCGNSGHQMRAFVVPLERRDIKVDTMLLLLPSSMLLPSLLLLLLPPMQHVLLFQRQQRLSSSHTARNSSSSSPSLPKFPLPPFLPRARHRARKTANCHKKLLKCTKHFQGQENISVLFVVRRGIRNVAVGPLLR